MKSILDNSFHYTPSSQTDVRKTFARLRQEQRLAEATRVQNVVAKANVQSAQQRYTGGSSRKA